MNYPNMVTGIFHARPNRFIAHGTVDQLLEECGLTAAHIAQRIKAAMHKTEKNHA